MLLLYLRSNVSSDVDGWFDKTLQDDAHWSLNLPCLTDYLRATMKLVYDEAFLDPPDFPCMMRNHQRGKFLLDRCQASVASSIRKTCQDGHMTWELHHQLKQPQWTSQTLLWVWQITTHCKLYNILIITLFQKGFKHLTLKIVNKLLFHTI